MLEWLTVLACTLYLVPLGAVVALGRRESDDTLDLACAIGAAFAVDLLGTFALCYLFRLDRAVFVRTGLLLVVAAALAARRVRRGEPILPGRGALSRGDLLTLGLAAAAGFLVSHMVSSQYWIWDREWHVEFTASLRAQQMPFRNVFEPWKTLRYHMAGDVAAAGLQSLSFASMNASRALSYAHDLQSLILVAMTALAFRSSCGWKPATTVAAAVVPPLAGPMMFRVLNQVPGLGPFEGNSDFSNLTLSFRPHCMIALVVLVALLCHVMRRARDQARPRVESDGRARDILAGAAMTALVSLLSISDEISTLLVGSSLAVMWLRWPRLLGGTRWRSAIALGGFAVAAIVTNRVLAGTIAPGGPVEHTHWMSPRLPRFGGPPHPLGDLEGWKQLFIDEGSLLLPMLMMLALFLPRRPAAGDDLLRPPVALALGTTLLGLLLFLMFEVNGRTFEGHRFMTAARSLVPVAALLFLPRLPRASFASLLVLMPILAGVFATLGFVFYRLPVKPAVQSGEEQYQVECRRDVGARLGEPIVPTFAERPLWHVYAGCRPIFAPGHDGSPGVVLAGWPMFGPAGFAKMDREFFPAEKPARVVCPRDPDKLTPICQKAQTLATCTPQGRQFVACDVPAASRPLVLQP
jgi:hypothetical protein